MSVRVCLVKNGALPVLSDEHKHERVGGEEVQHALLARALQRQGWDVRLVVGDYGQPAEADFDGVRAIRSFREGSGLPIIRFVYPRWIKLWQALARADADVYYLSCAGMELGLAAMFCRARGKRLVFRVASDSDCDPARLLVPYGRDKWLYEYGLRRCDAVIVQSVLQQQLLREHYGINSAIARMLVEQPAAQQLQADIDVLWVANLRRVKRPDRLLAIAKALPQFRFHMAGGPFPGEADLYERIRADAANIPNLTFHGAVPYRDVSRLFDRARLFVNTSELEGFPNTFVQSWVRGIPVAATFDPDGVLARHGLGASAPDERALVSAIDALLTQPARYEEARAAVQRHFQQHYSEQQVLGPYLEALRPAEAAEAFA
jgi:glycosyltransferase involved in cell wall biosynthesis